MTDSESIPKILGLYTPEKMQETLDKYISSNEPLISDCVRNRFIDEYIVCSICELPELSLSVKNDELMGECRACSAIACYESSNKFVKFLIKKEKEKGETKKIEFED